jgi:hypothetical protein
VALLLILLAVFALLGFGSGSAGTSTGSGGSEPHAAVQRSQGLTGTDCVDVTWKAGQPAHVRSCHKAPGKP